MGEGARWADLERLEGWAGEVRVNRIRLASLIAFYGYHLLNVYVLERDDPSLRGSYHAAVTALVLAWSFLSVLLHFCLARRWSPPALKYGATLLDTALVTALLVVSGGPKSMLVVLYFLVIASTPLRLSLRLVWTATLGTMAAWVLLLGYSKYYRPPDERLARTAQVIFALGLGAAGLLAGQAVRQARRLVRGYPVTVEDGESPEAGE